MSQKLPDPEGMILIVYNICLQLIQVCKLKFWFLCFDLFCSSCFLNLFYYKCSVRCTATYQTDFLNYSFDYFKSNYYVAWSRGKIP